MSVSSTPIYINVANVVASPLIVGTMGAALGYSFIDKPVTYGLQWALIDLFWKYAVPNTLGKVFFHAESNLAANVLGIGVSYFTSCAIPLFYGQLVSYIPPKTPYVGYLAREVKKTIVADGGEEIILMTFIASGIIGLKNPTLSLISGVARFAYSALN
jgi:hypothetical protein